MEEPGRGTAKGNARVPRAKVVPVKWEAEQVKQVPLSAARSGSRRRRRDPAGGHSSVCALRPVKGFATYKASS